MAAANIFNFRINEEIISLKFPVDGSDDLFKFSSDDTYTVNYLFELANNGFISLNKPIEFINKIDDEGREIQIYALEAGNDAFDGLTSPDVDDFPSEQQQKHGCEWTEDETRMLLDLYEDLLSKVGPLKKFRTKKNMWNHIANVLNDHFKRNKTGLQVENRYKTVLKRKKLAVQNNCKSGSSREPIPYESELSKIASIDDSIQPEVTGTAQGLKIMKERSLSHLCTPGTSKPYKKRVKSIQETLLEILEKKRGSKRKAPQRKT